MLSVDVDLPGHQKRAVAVERDIHNRSQRVFNSFRSLPRYPHVEPPPY